LRFESIQQAYNTLISNKYKAPVYQANVKLSLFDLLTGCVATAIVKLDKHTKMIEFRVPAMTAPGTTIKFFDGESTHAYIAVTVDVETSGHCILISPHVVVQKTINKFEANTGIDLSIENFDGNTHNVNIPQGTSASKLIYVFPEQGFFNSNTKERGDLKVVVEIQHKR
jgi:DnaJ-class molecular chaperone